MLTAFLAGGARGEGETLKSIGCVTDSTCPFVY
jgi:hypothetical protein